MSRPWPRREPVGGGRRDRVTGRPRLASVLGAAVLILMSMAAAASVDAGTHDAWDSLLREHVRDGRVDYKALAAKRSELRSYLATLEGTTPSRLESRSRDERLAFWINAYNAYTIRLVLDHYPIDGIWSITPLWKRPLGGPFAIDFIPLGHLAPGVGGAEISLGEVEHEILRKRFDEPRIHFAIVCASKGCPILQDRAYTGAEIDGQLDRASTDFLGDPARNRYEPDRNRLAVSPIFKWFSKDFQPGGGPAGFMGRYGPEAARRALRDSETSPSVTYTSYDWTLNE